MTYEIIKNSESHTGYNIPDVEFLGMKAGLGCGWQYEFEKDGEYAYSSVCWEEETAEDYANRWHTENGTPWLFDVFVDKGYRFTGRVVFRGYAESYYDAEEREWFVREVEVPAPAPAKPKKVWSEDEIARLIQTNDKVAGKALEKLYDCQTAEEQAIGETRVQNGAGFNGADARILSSMAEFFKKTGFLTPKQLVVVRKKLVKYNKQLTRLANA